MSRVIPKEQLAGYQRWQAGSFDKPAQAGGEPARAGSPPPAQEAANLATAAEQAGEMVVDIPFPTAEDLARFFGKTPVKRRLFDIPAGKLSGIGLWFPLWFPGVVAYGDCAGTFGP
jgi:hypothetical protein